MANYSEEFLGCCDDIRNTINEINMHVGSGQPIKKRDAVELQEIVEQLNTIAARISNYA